MSIVSASSPVVSPPLVSSSGSRCSFTGGGVSLRIPTRGGGQSHSQTGILLTLKSRKIGYRRNMGGPIRSSSSSSGKALSPELKTSLDKFVTSEKVILFMKGTKDFPQCGFSNTCVQILKSLNVAFETVNILDNEILRQGLKEYSQWPTFPQLYIDGEFFGGCDITVEAYKSGELQELLEKAQCS